MTLESKVFEIVHLMLIFYALSKYSSCSKKRILTYIITVFSRFPHCLPPPPDSPGNLLKKLGKNNCEQTWFYVIYNKSFTLAAITRKTTVKVGRSLQDGARGWR